MKVKTFHKSVMGYNHIGLHAPGEDYGEDASFSYSADDGSFYIAIVADGHGSDKCFRSHIGSQLACDACFECLKSFAEARLSEADDDGNDFSESPRENSLNIKQLTDSIVAGWYDKAKEDYESNPPAPEEIGKYANYYQDKANFIKCYGTTLIAALWMQDDLFLIHQGDGRCDVLCEKDGVYTFEQPVPWDDRCDLNQTTSLCDMDAPESFRSCVWSISDHNVKAVILHSDGVEDTFRDTYADHGGSHALMGGVHTFSKWVLKEYFDTGSIENLEESLEKVLPILSRSGMFSVEGGKGDDVSVAGIFMEEEVSKLLPQFSKDIQRYDFDEQLFWVEDRISSKSRKRSFLENKKMEAEEKFAAFGLTIKEKQDNIDLLSEKIEKLTAELEQATIDLKEYKQDNDKYQARNKEDKTASQKFLDTYRRCANMLRDEEKTLQKKVTQLSELIADEIAKKEVLLKDLEEMQMQGSQLKEEMEHAATEFNDYNEVCLALEEKRDLIQSRIQELG